MSFDDPRNANGGSLQRLLNLLGRHSEGSQSSFDPMEDYQAMIARDARLPRTGGLFGGEYARFMADAAARYPATSTAFRTPADNAASNLQAGREGATLDRDQFDPSATDGAIVDRGLAGPGDGAQFIEVGNPANPRLRREWERKYGRPWPRDPATGRNYDVAHIRALADGGTNTVENIRPMHPAEHLAEHVANGDHARWGRRAAIARAFGGTVARALTPLEIISGITGVLSGRIRRDSFDNFSSDWMGWQSKEDQRKAFEYWQKQLDPNWKPGELVI